jgi:hypothetical protein
MTWILTSIFYLLFALHGQMSIGWPGPGPVHVSTGGGTWSLVQVKGDQSNESGATVSIAGDVVTLTGLTALGSGHALVVWEIDNSGSSKTISSLTSADCSGSWVIPGSPYPVYNSSEQTINVAYCTSSASGGTSVAVTMNTTPSSPSIVVLYEFAWSGSSITIDGGSSSGLGSVSNQTAANPQTLAAITLGGATDVMLEFWSASSGTFSSINDSYTVFHTGSGSGVAFSYGDGTAYLLNTSSGSAPSVTLSASEKIIAGAIALQGH